ncbi:TetR/AcrR family transcriptional regulator [Brevibacillus choshinensis]|uniref:TetR/AcrR family transcriptional regulator n=1 Tax=Brevibacillus choshinensis TaxID=54911 RepID=A0ABX7FMU4_BRECH|nr:TetR/AcrR family transcriptional regulator [Brevibacillus choshinensis]QRG66607.1 TetR/AcrR family transcriptional regulator [Brevibacillus choshinensis]
MQSIHQNPSFQLLLSITEELIEEKGCHQTTLQDIIKRSGLSKGAIYHYVKSKDELLGLLLQKRLERIGTQFYEKVHQGEKNLHSPLAAISDGLRHIHDPKDVTNLIFIYLLSKKDDPTIGQMLSAIYERSVHNSQEWIELGQKSGVIPGSLDAAKTAALFTILTYGIRVQTVVSPEIKTLGAEDVFEIMYQTLSKG